MRCLVVNCSSSRYNLGALKLANWLRESGHTVTECAGDPAMFSYGFDLVCLSVIFSWDAPAARDIAVRLKDHADIWAGGPGLTQLAGWWKRETGLTCTLGIDKRFDRQEGAYQMTFASRGCPVGCYFCIVPRIEGKTFTLDWDFKPAPILCDNNLSALPVDFQEHIISRYLGSGIGLMDANSGFEPKAFDEGTYRRWKPVLRGPWRFAYDELTETAEVKAMMDILSPESSRKKRVYVLIGNEPIAACYERAQRVIEWGGEPYCQPLISLRALSKDALTVRHDWTWQKLKDFSRYYNRPALWRGGMTIQEYSNRKFEMPPFRELIGVPEMEAAA